LGVAEWIQVFDRFTDGRIPREAVPVVAQRMAQEGLAVEVACESLGIALQGKEQWLGAIDNLTMEGYDSERADCDEKRVRFLAGKAVRMLKGKAPASDVAAFIRTKLSAEVVR
jgi:Glu-tRNA(Gln) amidotransferase subunit E-like FAD-binding protein